MAYKVFKFGGSSIRDANNIRNVASILDSYKEDSIAIVVSALGKTTNALEKVVEAYMAQSGAAAGLATAIKANHLALVTELFEDAQEVAARINDLFVEVDWILDEMPSRDYDYYYDQIVSIGELASSTIVAAFLNQSGKKTTLVDARDLIRTDNHYREGWVEWPVTKEQIQKIIPPILDSGQLVLTQGFIGNTSENFTTTLGREGSDYSAAIVSHCIDAESMTIWKDVPGVLNADPDRFKNVVKIDRLSYREAIEMTYYGASVIHPKTIKPIQNKSIPLYVKSFINPKDQGTEISGDVDDNYPPIVVVEDNQVLLHISTRDFSFIAEHHMGRIFNKIAEYRLFVNAMQNTAISFTICLNNLEGRIDKLVAEIEHEFKVIREENLELITIRHYNEDYIEELRRGKIVLFEERIRATIHMVVKNVPVVERIN